MLHARNIFENYINIEHNDAVHIYLTKFPTHLVRFLPIFQKRIDQKRSNSKHDKTHHFEIM